MVVVTSYLSKFDDATPVCVGRRSLAAAKRKRTACGERTGLLSPLWIEREHLSEHRRDHFLEFHRILGGGEMTAREDDAFRVLDLLGGALSHFGGAGEIIVAGEEIDRKLPRYFRDLIAVIGVDAVEIQVAP